MARELAFQELHNGPTLAMRDVRCRPACGECGQEECTDHDTIVFVRGGAFVRRMRGEDAFADSNRILFFNRGEPYRVYHPVDGGDDCTSLTFSPEVLREAMGAVNRNAGDSNVRFFQMTEAPLDGPTLACLHRLRQRATIGTVDALGVEEASLRLLTRVVGLLALSPGRKSIIRSSTSNVHRSLVIHTREFLAASFCRPMSLAQVARAVHSSPYHLARIFARETGSSVHRHLVRLRLAAGLEALFEGAEDLSRLALDLGFSSHSHFSHAFRLEFGFSPSEMRLSRGRPNFREMSKILKVRGA